MKRKRLFALLLAVTLLAGCSTQQGEPEEDLAKEPEAEIQLEPDQELTDPLPAEILLSNQGITMKGQMPTEESFRAVYTARDIVYYPKGQDFTFGEGTVANAHSEDMEFMEDMELPEDTAFPEHMERTEGMAPAGEIDITPGMIPPDGERPVPNGDKSGGIDVNEQVPIGEFQITAGGTYLMVV